MAALRFGWFPDPSAKAAADILTAARAGDARGLDLIGIQDHPYNSGHLDAWTLLSAIGGCTSRVELLPDVANLPLRPAPMLAKAAASLDVITGGRAVLGLGAGAFWEAMAGMGAPKLAPKQAVDAVEEAIAVAREWWSGDSAVWHEGEHYRLDGAHPGPKPTRRIPIWLGAIGPRMQRITGRLADGWLPSMPYVDEQGLDDGNRRIDDAAHAAGRDPAAITRAYNLWGSGDVDGLVEICAGLALEHRVDTFILGGPPTEAWVATIAEEIAPRTRALVAAA